MPRLEKSFFRQLKIIFSDGGRLACTHKPVKITKIVIFTGSTSIFVGVVSTHLRKYFGRIKKTSPPSPHPPPHRTHLRPHHRHRPSPLRPDLGEREWIRHREPPSPGATLPPSGVAVASTRSRRKPASPPPAPPRSHCSLPLPSHVRSGRREGNRHRHHPPPPGGAAASSSTLRAATAWSRHLPPTGPRARRGEARGEGREYRGRGWRGKV